MIKVYGLKACDTCRKAMKWLQDKQAEAVLIDLRGPEMTPDVMQDLLAGWVAVLGWEVLLNRRGTTWRTVPEEDKTPLDQEHALALMVAYPALVKRPVFVMRDRVSVGFGAAQQEDLTALLSEPVSDV